MIFFPEDIWTPLYVVHQYFCPKFSIYDDYAVGGGWVAVMVDTHAIIWRDIG